MTNGQGRTHDRRWTIRTGLTLAALGAGTLVRAWAVTQVDKVVVVAGAFTTAAPPGESALGAPVQIVHVPLRGISPISKLCIIQGQAGEAPKNISPSFPSRITPIGESPQNAGGEIRGGVFYAMVDPNGRPG